MAKKKTIISPENEIKQLKGDVNSLKSVTDKTSQIVKTKIESLTKKVDYLKDKIDYFRIGLLANLIVTVMLLSTLIYVLLK